MSLTRRDFIKANAAAAAASVAGVTLPLAAGAQAPAADGIRWDKGVCRYCGTGCGVLVGVKDCPNRLFSSTPWRAMPVSS